jgi:hypothetical protein
MLEHIGDLLPRFGTYAALFGTHEPLQRAVAGAGGGGGREEDPKEIAVER